jgi:translation elongation factor EF-Ts
MSFAKSLSPPSVTTVHANDGVIGVYKHGERIAVLTLLDGGDKDLAKDIAMHIAASKPECISIFFFFLNTLAHFKTNKRLYCGAF